MDSWWRRQRKLKDLLLHSTTRCWDPRRLLQFDEHPWQRAGCVRQHLFLRSLSAHHLVVNSMREVGHLVVMRAGKESLLSSSYRPTVVVR